MNYYDDEELTLKFYDELRQTTSSSESLLELADFMGKCSDFSFKNVMLIRIQNPKSTGVAKYNVFKNAGYSVKKEEKAMKIYEPKVVKGATRLVLESSVFDISQTNANEDSYSKIFPNRVNSSSIDGKDGLLEKGILEISSKNNIDSLNKSVKDIIHEIVSYSHSNDDEKELVTDLSSYIVCKNYNIDTTTDVKPTIDEWISKDYTPTMKEKFLNSVQKTSSFLIKKIDNAIVKESTKLVEQEVNVKQFAEGKNKTTTEKLTRKERIEQAKKVDIVAYCKSTGIDIKKDTERYYRLNEHDSCIIDRKKNQFYWNSRGKNGDIINFVQAIAIDKTGEERSFTGIVDELINIENDGSYTKYESSFDNKVNKSFKYNLANESSEFTAARKYLVDERKIDEHIVDYFHQLGLIKQDNKKNVLFVWKDEKGKSVGCSEHGTIQIDNKHSSWKKVQENSSHNEGFTFTNGKPKNLKFFESSIDLLSYATINKNNMKDTQLVSMEGLKPNVVYNYISKGRKILGCDPDSVSLAVDNDKAGNKFYQSYGELGYIKLDGSVEKMKSEIPPKTDDVEKYDWNDMLKRKVEKQKKLSIKKKEMLFRGSQLDY